jgi:hypothetical protein
MQKPTNAAVRADQVDGVTEPVGVVVLLSGFDGGAFPPAALARPNKAGEELKIRDGLAPTKMRKPGHLPKKILEDVIALRGLLLVHCG